MNVIHFEKKEWNPSHVDDIIRGCQLISDAHIKLNLKLFGEEHPLTAASYSSVGSTLERLGRHQEALETQQKTLDRR